MDALELDSEMDKFMSEPIEEETPQMVECEPWSLEELEHKPGMEPNERPPRSLMLMTLIIISTSQPKSGYPRIYTPLPMVR